MDLLSKDEFLLQKDRRISQLENGKLFIYPTDTIYGIGCDATNATAVQKIRELKDRPTAPFSVIAPSKEWILENCTCPPLVEEWVSKLPGPYTLVLNPENPDCVSPAVFGDAETLGVRIPKHWIAKIVAELGKPIVTTSVNKVGKEFLTDLAKLSAEFRDSVAFCIDEGEKNGKPSTVINLTGGAVEVVHRK